MELRKLRRLNSDHKLELPPREVIGEFIQFDCEKCPGNTRTALIDYTTGQVLDYLGVPKEGDRCQQSYIVNLPRGNSEDELKRVIKRAHLLYFHKLLLNNQA